MKKLTYAGLLLLLFSLGWVTLSYGEAAKGTPKIMLAVVDVDSTNVYFQIKVNDILLKTEDAWPYRD